MNNKILYWPGRGQSLDILRPFRKSLEEKGYTFDYINIEYDKGDFNPSTWEQVKYNNSDWWIGISFGASLLYYCLKYSNNIPKRITLINPFFSRDILSKEKNFDLTNQWNFAPIDNKVKVKNIDIVLSVNDTKIPMYHGIKLINNTICNNKQIIFIEDNHTIDEVNAQTELSNVLHNKINLNRGANDEKYHYCNIYKQQ